MSDREKMIETLQKALDNSEIDGNIYAEVRRPAIFDLIYMLKGMAPVEPIRGEDMDSSSACWWYVCPSCRIAIDYKDRFCRHCGQELKWK